MKAIYVYPGRFSPPTRGHYEVVKKAALSLPRLYVVCSVNPKKQDIFSTEESMALWQGYDLPRNATVLTLEEFSALGIDHERLVIVRGLRNYQDLKDEKIVMELNKDKFGIDKYIYFLSDDGFETISASKARALASALELEELRKYAAPLSITGLLEKILGFQNIFLVVGRPGSGKSTFLRLLKENQENIYHIDTDLFNKQLKPLLVERFGSADLVKIAVEREAELKAVIAQPWIGLLKNALIQAPRGSHVFVEAAYGLQPDKRLYDFVGGKVLYVGCRNERTNVRRLNSRNTGHMLPFVKRIPGWQESQGIARREKLLLSRVMTDGSLQGLENTANDFLRTINNQLVADGM